MSKSSCVPFDDFVLKKRLLSWVGKFESQPNAAQIDAIKPPPTIAEPRENLALDKECRAYEGTIYIAVVKPVPVEQLLNPAANILVQKIQDKLDQDTDDAREYGEKPPSVQSIKVCLQLSRLFAPHLALVPGIKWGAFTEDNGGISLVIQSLVSDRRLSCRIPLDGATLSAIQIDEKMTAQTRNVLLDNKDTWRELAEWVTSRD